MALSTLGFSIWFLGMITGNVIRAPYYKAHYTSSVEHSKKDVTEYMIMSLIAVGFILLPMSWFLFDLFLSFNWQQSLLLVVIGTSILPVAIWLFYRSHADLSKQWSTSLEIRKDHQLITTGVYGYIRNPMYAAVLLWSLCQPLLIPNTVVGFAGLVALIPLFLFRLPREERMMHDYFGEHYLQYKSRTKRLIPFIF